MKGNWFRFDIYSVFNNSDVRVANMKPTFVSKDRSVVRLQLLAFWDPVRNNAAGIFDLLDSVGHCSAYLVVAAQLYGT